MCSSLIINQEKEIFKQTLLSIDKSIDEGNRILNMIIKKNKKRINKSKKP